MDLFVGIDPGQTGALAAIDGTRKARFLAKAPDSAAGMADLVREVRRVGPIRLAVLERTQAMPGNGVVAMHNYGRHAGAWEGVLATLRVPVTQPYPKVWQVLVRAPGCRRGDTKKRSIASARRLFGVELKRSQDGMADALHMALWALHASTTGLSGKTASGSQEGSENSLKAKGHVRRSAGRARRDQSRAMVRG